MRLMWTLLFIALMGIFATVGYKLIEKQKHNQFLEQVVKFQSQTAEYEDKVYTPGGILVADWTFEPILWDDPVVMTAIFLFRNTDTQQVFLTGDLRVLPFFNQVQYQVSKPLDWSPQGKRLLTSTYHIPSHLKDGNYVIEICQEFSHNGANTDWSCYNGPVFEVKNTFGGG